MIQVAIYSISNVHRVQKIPFKIKYVWFSQIDDIMVILQTYVYVAVEKINDLNKCCFVGSD